MATRTSRNSKRDKRAGSRRPAPDATTTPAKTTTRKQNPVITLVVKGRGSNGQGSLLSVLKQHGVSIVAKRPSRPNAQVDVIANKNWEAARVAARPYCTVA